MSELIVARFYNCADSDILSSQDPTPFQQYVTQVGLQRCGTGWQCGNELLTRGCFANMLRAHRRTINGVSVTMGAALAPIIAVTMTAPPSKDVYHHHQASPAAQV